MGGYDSTKEKCILEGREGRTTTIPRKEIVIWRVEKEGDYDSTNEKVNLEGRERRETTIPRRKKLIWRVEQDKRIRFHERKS